MLCKLDREGWEGCIFSNFIFTSLDLNRGDETHKLITVNEHPSGGQFNRIIENLGTGH